MGFSTFRASRVAAYADAARTWLHDAATVVDTTVAAPRRSRRRSRWR